ncbi:MAG: hypothetical protein AABX34_05500 [Nanoarchaeota archaeon]
MRIVGLHRQLKTDGIFVFNSKKSTEVVSNWPFWMIFVVVMGFMVMIVVKTGNISVAEASRIPQSLEDEVLLAPRFYNLGECFAYVDESGRVHSKIIDQTKFTKERLDSCYAPSNANYAFQLILEPPIGQPEFPLSQIQTYNWIAGKFENTRIEDKVMVVFGNNIYEGKLAIKIQNVK